MGKSLPQLMSDYEKMVVTKTLEANGGDREKTAKALGIADRTLDKILRRHHLSKRRFTRPLPIPANEGE